MSSKKNSASFVRTVEVLSTPLQCVNDIATAWTDYLEIVEVEKSRRCEIKAWEKSSLAEIKAKRDLLITYLEKSFDEREKNFSSLFQLVDQAAELGDNQALALALESIVKLANSNPFRDLSDLQTVQKQLQDSDHIWEF